MPEPTVSIPTNSEGKLVFQSQGDYEKALDAQLQLPAGQADQKLLSQMLNRDSVVIQPAESQAPASGYTEPASPTSGGGNGAEPPAQPQGLIEKARQAAKEQGIDFSYENEDEFIKGLISKEKHNRFLESKLRSNGEQAPAPHSPESPQEPVEPQAEPEDEDPLAGVGESKQPLLEAARERLKRLDPVDDAEEYRRTQQEVDGLNAYEMARLGTIASRAVNATKKMRDHFGEREKAMMQAIKNVREEGQSKREEAKDEELAVEFQKQYKDFQTPVPIGDLDRQYLTWAKNLHHVRYGERTEDPAKLKKVVNDWLDGDIDLRRVAERDGIAMPKGMDKYMEICEILGYRKVLNAANPRRDHSMQDAYIYKLQLEGKLDEAMKAQRDLGAAAQQAAETQRDTNFARVLNANETVGQQPGEGMTEQKAWGIINSIDPIAIRLDPEKKKLRDGAMRFLGLNPT